jgi:hypothetical protein
MLLYAGNERFTVAVNPCIMYLEYIYVFVCPFLDCIIVLPLVVLHVLSHVA